MSVDRDLDVRRERPARNPSLFREVNERIEELSQSATIPIFICEYCDESCDGTIALTLERAPHLRAVRARARSPAPVRHSARARGAGRRRAAELVVAATHIFVELTGVAATIAAQDYDPA